MYNKIFRRDLIEVDFVRSDHDTLVLSERYSTHRVSFPKVLR